ncbi:MAG TPA: amidohydrolase family protein [Gemmatimonadaceae bacterium]
MDSIRRMVIDSHVHFWDPTALSYPWIGQVYALRRPFLPADFAALSEDRLDGIIVVEANSAAADAPAEVEFLAELATREPRIMGIVVFLDVTDHATLDATLPALARRDAVVGVRHNVQGTPRGYCLTSTFVRGVRRVAAERLTFDLCITADQFDEALSLVEQCDGVDIVLDHCGKPAIRNDAFAPWAAAIERMASHARVTCKISGLLTEARPDQRHADALRPYVDHVRACFGADRILYGSDWPVVTLAGGEALWRDIMDELTADWPAAEQEAFYSGNAARRYDLRRHASR